MKTKSTLIVTAITAAILFSGCGQGTKEPEEHSKTDAAVAVESAVKAEGISNELDLSTRTPDDKSFIKTAETKFMVRNVRTASEQIEDLAARYSGFLTYSNLRNQESDFARVEISRDSVLLSKRMVVENQMVLRIPNENLDSLIRELNNLILFLDYRVISMDEVTFALIANRKAMERLEDYTMRLKQHIGDGERKLREKSSAEESVLNRTLQADRLEIENQALADQVHYCTLTLLIYQPPVLYQETQVKLNESAFRANLFIRLFHALQDGWIIFEHVLVFLFRIWWLFALGMIGILLYKYVFKRKKSKALSSGEPK